MPLSQEKVDAYKKLEEAVEALTEAFRDDTETPAVPTGYLLLVGELKFSEPESDDDDEEEMMAVCGVYQKRGQNPLLSYGLAHEYIRHYNQCGNE